MFIRSPICRKKICLQNYRNGKKLFKFLSFTTKKAKQSRIEVAIHGHCDTKTICTPKEKIKSDKENKCSRLLCI